MAIQESKSRIIVDFKSCIETQSSETSVSKNEGGTSRS